MSLPSSRRLSVPIRTFGTPESHVQAEGDETTAGASTARRLLGKLSFSSLRRARPSFSFRSNDNPDAQSTPGAERPPIPTIQQPSGEIYSTPLPKLSMLVLSITMLGEFLSANVSTPFLLFMVKGFGEFADEAEVAFWTGILVATFFLTQFLTSLLWATIAEKHGRRAVLMISLLGSGITCAIFGTSTSLQQAICIRLLQGIFAGAVGVARGCVAFVTDPSNEGRAYAILGFCWGMGGVAGAIIGGSFERPAAKWPDVFGDVQLFITYPYLLPCVLAATVTLFGSFLSLFLGYDGGPREGAIRLLPEKIIANASLPDEDNISTHTSVFEEEEPLGITGHLKKKVSDYFAKRPDSNHGSPGPSSNPLIQPVVPLSASNPAGGVRLDRTRSYSTRTSGSAYGYSGAYRNRLASNATLRRGSMASSRRRRSSNVIDGRETPADNSDLNFAQRLLLANENAVTHIADLWVAAAINVDNEDPFESDSDIEAQDEDGEDVQDSDALPRADLSSPSAMPVSPQVQRLRHSSTNSRRPSTSIAPLSSLPHRPSVSFSPLVSPSRRPSTNIPAIFAHSGVRTPPAVLDAQQLLATSPDVPLPSGHLAIDPLMAIPESRTASEVHSPGDEESLTMVSMEKQPSITSQLPIVVIVQYGVMALHTTTHDQIFMSYLVSDSGSGGLNLNAGHFAQLIALMCLFQIAYQFYLYPNIGPPRGRFSHLAMFRIGTIMFIPAYLSVILYRPFHNVHPDDTNIFLMSALSISTAVRYCGTTFGYTAISILLNYMTPPAAVGYANGIAQSIVSLARCVGPVIGGYLWAMSVQDDPSGYYLGFVACAGVCALTVLQSFLIR